MILKFRPFLTAGFFIALLAIAGCSSNKLNPNLGPDERLKIAKALLDKGDYLRAKSQFTILTMNYPGTKIADKAQYYLGESHFGSKEYILAASEFEKLIRNYPNSEFVDDAQYKLGMCYYELSPNYQLDQKYTLNAIVEFQKFLEEYPTSDLRDEVEKKLSECRDKLARKEFGNAEIYRKMAYFNAAVIYYDLVLSNYYDTPYAEKALYNKGICLEKVEKWEEAEKVFELFMAKYPKSHYVSSVKSELRSLQDKISQEKKN